MRFLALLLVLLILAACGDDSGRVHEAAYAAKMAQFKSSPAPAGSTIVVGDSIIDGWSDLPIGWYNRGIGMDTAADVSLRLSQHLENDQPQVVILLIGINRIEESTASWPAIIDIMKRRPDIQWYVVSLLPNSWECGKSVQVFNAWLQGSIKGVASYIDIYKLFVSDGRGGALYTDGLHPSKAGYEILSRGLIQAVLNGGL
jgi:lysophospholipase L1-like esterase